jgi:TonB family protein
VNSAIQLLGTFLLNASWQIVLIAGAAWLCDWLLKSAPARYRHAAWVMAFVLSLLIPALSMPGNARIASPPAAMPPPVVENRPVVITTIRSIDGEVIEPARPMTPGPASPTLSAIDLHSPVRISRNAALGFIGLYLLSVLYASLRFLRAWRRTRKIVSTASSLEWPASIQSIIQDCERTVGVRNARFLCSASVAVPITVGTFRPLIILPLSFLSETSRDVLTAAIGHELVHVARRDYLTNLLYEFVYLPLSFHPAAMLMRRHIRRTRELCCDEWVASKLLRPEVYARSLVRLIGGIPVTRRLAADTTIGIAESDNLEVRIMSLLKMGRLGQRRKAVLLIAALGLLVAPCVAASSLALNFEINGQEPAKIEASGQKRERGNQEKLRTELERQIQELKQREQQVTGSERDAITAHILEVQRALEEHQKLLQQYEQQKQLLESGGEAQLDEARKLLEQYRKQDSPEKAREAQARLQELLSKYPENASNARAFQELYEAEAQLLQRQSAEENQQLTRKARVIYRVEPIYPLDAREKKITGSVLLTLVVNREGNPEDIQVYKSLYPSMDQAAIEAARKMKFEPAMKDGQPVTQKLLVEFYFSVESKHVEVMGTGEGRGAGGGVGYAVEARRRKDETQVQEDRARRQAELVQGANISMDRAIQIATSQYPGKVLACSLGREKDGPVFYHLVIINTDGEKRTTRYVWVSAVDGTIIKSEEEARTPSISGGVLNGKAVILPHPEYPLIARQAQASGTVTVQITIDEEGNVVSAKAVSGHPLLQSAAVDAARRAKFTPTLLEGEPVKVSGQVVYNFGP